MTAAFGEGPPPPAPVRGGTIGGLLLLQLPLATEPLTPRRAIIRGLFGVERDPITMRLRPGGGPPM